MVSRDAKRIANRGAIRMQIRIAKGCHKLYVMPMETGIKPGIDIATDRPEAMCMASRNVNWFDRHIFSRMELLIKERAVIRTCSCLEPRIHMRESSRIDCYVVTRIGNPISMKLLIRVNMLLVNCMGTTKAMQIGMPMGARMATRVPKGCHKRVSIGCVSWTGNRVPSYYGRHDSARRDSARRPAEGRQR